MIELDNTFTMRREEGTNHFHHILKYTLSKGKYPNKDFKRILREMLRLINTKVKK